MIYKTRINVVYLFFCIGFLIGFNSFWIWYLVAINQYFDQLNQYGSPALKVICWLLWGFIFLVIGPLLFYGLVRNTFSLTLMESGIRVQYWLLFTRKEYRWSEFEGFTQSRKPIKSWIGRLLLWSRENHAVIFHLRQKKEITLHQITIKGYDQLINQLALFPILNRGWEQQAEKEK